MPGVAGTDETYYAKLLVLDEPRAGGRVDVDGPGRGAAWTRW